eukprot:TRINITY_DN23960_c0_g1_i1.p1 TRINITY_DN23960_c0_g1~~TRINITY_DN23960_c0_g1_i1.p1  ORF type:complete len:506 (+),score=53.45 TRINITY_DN23960_c0_g1_i1:208-1725(+)
MATGKPSASASTGTVWSAILYGGVVVALAVLTFMGVPWMAQDLGAAVFLMAFPLLWLNERRTARMTQLFLKALKKMQFVYSDASAVTVDPELEGQLVLAVGPLHTETEDRPILKNWGVEAPVSSVAVRVCVETYRPIKGPFRRICSCRHGEWLEDDSEVPSVEARSKDIRLGAFRLLDGQMQFSRWRPFSPKLSEHLKHILEGAQQSVLAMLRVSDSLPFPGEIPLVLENSSVLYFPRGGGQPENPRLGDVRVSFLHIPNTKGNEFTVVGVQRGEWLEPFRYRNLPPSGWSMGRFDTKEFNIGALETVTDDDEKSELLSQTGDEIENTRNHQTDGKEGPHESWLHPNISFSLEAWRQVLHRAVPETLVYSTCGSHGRCSFCIRAFHEEFLLAWQIRACGFALMVSGVEIACWRWTAVLAFLPGGALLGNAIWAVAVIGSAGFTALISAVAGCFYQPVAAFVNLSAASVLFALLMGKVRLLMALLFVGGCMLSLVPLLLFQLACVC